MTIGMFSFFTTNIFVVLGVQYIHKINFFLLYITHYYLFILLNVYTSYVIYNTNDLFLLTYLNVSTDITRELIKTAYEYDMLISSPR